MRKRSTAGGLGALASLGLAWLAAAGCRRSTEVDAAKDASPDGATAAVVLARVATDAGRGKLAAIDMQVNVYTRPDPTSPRYGYLRLGTVVDRDAQPAGNDRCPGGWFAVAPRGYVCANGEVTFDTNHPLVRASQVRPDTTKPLPYKYAFLSGAAPLYLRIPNSEEQKKAEYHLKYHEGWYERHHREATRVVPGANDVLPADRGAPILAQGASSAAASSAAAPLGVGATAQRSSTELSLGELFGGKTDADPIPFWLENGRTIDNVADFKPAPKAYFAKKVWRHTGLALVGSFPTGPDARSRRFAVTVDLRLVPADRMKPDTASPFHGVALSDALPLPLAFVRSECDPKEGKPCAHVYRLDPNKLEAREVHQLQRTYPYRSVVRLTGKKVDVEGTRYYETTDAGDWIRGRDAGVAAPPETLPQSAKNGQKWIEVSILQQTLVLWEGQKPVFMTLVSTGQDGTKDPKTTKSTPMGFFRIQSKHVTATMDANEQSAQGKAPESADKDVGEPKMPEPKTAARDERERSVPAAKPERRRRDDEKSDDPDEKQQWGRPEGSFELRDVPYVEYFSSGYALHAAYWHDVFGQARSHGCINLSPIDAHYLFTWTDPPVPDDWHGVFVTKDGPKGTLVMVHE